jgi:predicted HTH transcriptional regulator
MDRTTLTDEQFAELIGLPYESRRLEFKGAWPRTDRLFFARVVRAALGMANLQDGGRIIIGVDEQGGTFNPVGLSTADLATWRYDDVAAGFAAYADPALPFGHSTHNYQGKQFVMLEIYEFDELPVLCKTTYQGPLPGQQVILRAGACYVRSQGKPETSEIPTQTEMRELLDLAIEKGVRRLITRALRVGFQLPGGAAVVDEEQFDQQLEDVE